MHLRRKLIYFLVMPVCWGCNRSAPGPLPSSELTASVYSLADAAQNQRQFEKLFVKGAVLDAQIRPRYAKLMFSVAKVASLSDSQAELVVDVQDSDGKRLGEVTWTVLKEGGKWKMKTAPLP